MSQLSAEEFSPDLSSQSIIVQCTFSAKHFFGVPSIYYTFLVKKCEFYQKIRESFFSQKLVGYYLGKDVHKNYVLGVLNVNLFNQFENLLSVYRVSN